MKIGWHSFSSAFALVSAYNPHTTAGSPSVYQVSSIHTCLHQPFRPRLHPNPRSTDFPHSDAKKRRVDKGRLSGASAQLEGEATWTKDCYHRPREQGRNRNTNSFARWRRRRIEDVHVRCSLFRKIDSKSHLQCLCRPRRPVRSRRIQRHSICLRSNGSRKDPYDGGRK